MGKGSSHARKWRMRSLYVVLVFALLYIQLLPLQFTPRNWAGPDFIILLTVAWAIRRPEYTPAIIVAVMTLLADLVLLRPPGVLAAIMVVARQALKRQAAGLRDSTFVAEWITASLALAAILLANRLMLAMFLVDQAPLGTSVIQLAMNVAFYPLVVFATRIAFGVRKVVPGETDAVAGAS